MSYILKITFCDIAKGVMEPRKAENEAVLS